MTVDAELELSKNLSIAYGNCTMTIVLDTDYISANVDEVYECISEKLYDVFGRTVSKNEYVVTNIDIILSELQ